MFKNKRGIIKIETITVLTGQYDVKTRQRIVKMIFEEIIGFLFSLMSTLASSPSQLFREKRNSDDAGLYYIPNANHVFQDITKNILAKQIKNLEQLCFTMIKLWC